MVSQSQCGGRGTEGGDGADGLFDVDVAQYVCGNRHWFDDAINPLSVSPAPRRQAAPICSNMIKGTTRDVIHKYREANVAASA